MTRQIPLTRGLVALVDEADFAAAVAAGKWQAVQSGEHVYAGRSQGGKTMRLHTFLTGWPLVDHINGDGLDNRRANLRPATQSQNNANSRRSSANTSGYKGVSLYRRTGRWRAYLGTRPREIHLGYFATREEAARAYDRAAIETWGDYARTNFPREDYAA